MLNSSIRYLSAHDMERVHEASLYLLEHKGVRMRSDDALQLMRAHGARTDGDIVFLPRALVEECLRLVPERFTLEAIDPARSVTVGEGLLIHPAGGEVFVRDADGTRRSATMQDYIAFQKLYQYCSNIHITGYQPITPQDVPARVRGMQCLRAAMRYTNKPWLAPMDFVDRQQKKELLDLFDIVFGAGYLDRHYVTWNVTCPESPLVYCQFACEGILEFASRNQPVTLVSAPMSGITAPVFPFATILLQNAEMLAGLCLAECCHPGVPVLPSASLTFGNLRTANWECACPDTAFMLAAAVQMHKTYYHMPSRAQTGVTSSKCIDYQAGYETMQSLLLTALAGVNVTSQSVGTLENLLTSSLEKTLIDDEIVSRVKRILEGFPVDDASLAVDVIMRTPHGADFLCDETTLDHMRDGWQAYVSDWSSYAAWAADPARDIVTRAAGRVAKVLAEQPVLLDDKTDGQLARYIDSIA